MSYTVSKNSLPVSMLPVYPEGSSYITIAYYTFNDRDRYILQ